jgi:hypothetical protein
MEASKFAREQMARFQSELSTNQRGKMNDDTKVFAVDRREGEYIVLIDDEGASLDVSASGLPSACRHEGAIIRVPIDGRGNLIWRSSMRDAGEEKRRIKDAENRLDRLGRSDDGKDVKL